jgi:uncharacterized protein (DUF111 family)
MPIAILDPFSGIAGDMVLGALFDAGVPVDVVEQPLGKLPIEGFQLEVTRVDRQGIAATAVRVRGENSAILRNYFSIRSLIENADLSDRARALALGIYRRLAEAEATAHGKDVAHVPFHELGPAVVELLKNAPVYSQGIPYELTTPTGAAILAATVERWGDIPAMRVARAGYGAGARELEIPNVLRVLIGEPATDEELFGPVPAVLLETNIDDMNPELYEYVIERLFAAGAQDAWMTPIVMKRGRPAATLSVLVGSGEERAARDVIFAETTTLGVRRRTVEKWAVPRDVITVEVAGQTVRVKVARGARGVLGIYPEYADCAHVAREARLALKQVYADAQLAARRQLEATDRA